MRSNQIADSHTPRRDIFPVNGDQHDRWRDWRGQAIRRRSANGQAELNDVTSTFVHSETDRGLKSPPQTPLRNERSKVGSPSTTPKKVRPSSKWAASTPKATAKRRDSLFDDSCLDTTPSNSKPRIALRRTQEDSRTEFFDFEVKRWHQEHRTAITKRPAVLPRNIVLLNLLQRQRDGRFIEDLIGEGRMQSWAPELSDLFRPWTNGKADGTNWSLTGRQGTSKKSWS